MHLLYIVALQESTTQYSEKVKSRSAKDKELFSLGWKVDELSHLSDDGRRLMVEVTRLFELLNDKSDLVALNMANRLSELSKLLEMMLKGTSCIMSLSFNSLLTSYTTYLRILPSQKKSCNSCVCDNDQS